MNKSQLELFLRKSKETGNPHIIRLCEAIEDYLELYERGGEGYSNPKMYLQELQASYQHAWDSLHEAAGMLNTSTHRMADHMMNAGQISSEDKKIIESSHDSVEKRVSVGVATPKTRFRNKNTKV